MAKAAYSTQLSPRPSSAPPTDDPIWKIMAEEGRTIAWLARKTGFAPSYCYHIRKGRYPASGEFKAACANALNREVADLFLDSS